MQDPAKRVKVLQMENITKRFPGVTALDQVNFDIMEGEVVALIGAGGLLRTGDRAPQATPFAYHAEGVLAAGCRCQGAGKYGAGPGGRQYDQKRYAAAATAADGKHRRRPQSGAGNQR